MIPSQDQDWTSDNGFDDVYRQACGGSIAAIVQILNQKLASDQIRTRAIIAGGSLQLLCEAPTAENLDRDHTVERVRAILEQVAPRGIRKVTLYARLVQEQQLLWLEAIQREPEDLLWSEPMILKRSHWFRWVFRNLTSRQRDLNLPTLGSTLPAKAARTQFWVGAAGGAILSVFLLGLVAWNLKWITIGNPPATPIASTTNDPFVKAVRLAETAALGGQTAKTRQQWLELATQWQAAADLMEQVTPDDRRAATARDRAQRYRQNSQQARQQAELAPAALP